MLFPFRQAHAGPPDGKLSVVRRVVRLLSVALLVSANALGSAAFAQPAGAEPAKAQPVSTSECTAVTPDGYQLCSTDKGALQVVQAPGGASFYRLSLTFVRELRRNGTLVYRSDEQHADLDMNQKPGGSPANELVRAGTAIVAGSATCTFDDRSVVTNNTLHRDVSNLACTPAASAAAAAPAALPTYSDYSAVNDYSSAHTAPNGLGTPIRYGTIGTGNSKSDDCTVTIAANPQTAVNKAAAGAVICVKPGDYSTSTLTVNKAVTVRANGVVKLKNIVVSGSNAVVEGFTVVGGTLGNPNYGIKFSGTGHKIINNLVRGRGIWYGIGCEQSAGCGCAHGALMNEDAMDAVDELGAPVPGPE